MAESSAPQRSAFFASFSASSERGTAWNPGTIPARNADTDFIFSGVIFMIIRIAMVGAAQELAAAMLPVVFATAIFNAILVQALYIPVCKALKVND